MLRQGYVPDEPRVRPENNALAEAGHTVDAIGMRAPGEARFERAGQLTYHRLPMMRRRTSFARYVLEYAACPPMAGLYLTWLDLCWRFDLVQVHSVPDWLVFAAAGPRLRRVPILLDLHECVPKFYASKFHTSVRHSLVRLLAVLAQASSRFATRAIMCTEQMRKAFASRGA